MTVRFSRIVRRIASLLLSSVVAAAGCAWIPQGDPPAVYLEPPELKETLAEVTSRLQQWPEDRWWEQFNNGEINQLMEAALRDNPGLKVASARLREAQGLVRVEGARLLPFLEADASLTYERISQHGVFAALNPEVAGARILLGIINPLSFRYEFDFWGKNRATLEAALGQAAAEEAERAEVRLRLTTGIARAYFRGQALHRQLELVRAIVDLRKRLRRLAETRYALGLDNDLAVKQAIADYEAAVTRCAGVRDQLDVQRHLLARLIGKGPDDARHLFEQSAPVIPEQAPVPEHLSIGLLVHRPDLAAALYRADSAARMVKVAKTQFYPTIDLTAFVGFNALTLTNGADKLANFLFSGQSFSYGVAPGFRLPIFEGGRLRGELAVHRAEYDAAVELYNDTLLGALREVADSLSAWQATRDMLESHHRLVASLTEDWRLANVRLVSGLDDDREVLRHRYPVLEQEYALRALESDQLVAAVDLIEALGGGYHNPDIAKRPAQPAS
ncbi:efflux transporter outer membrane subunit [Nitrospira moscoviensis]|uniref:Putative Multidrug resistance outer membrane protein n=1 Tax=Nitrospira moscoviensis TaxID=42253 RepID=A0A0K2GFJ6_NITMO|nr:efflux transporter outer membrane subunit [Nitrospira moscoviensis]ALA59624.1 putative Multidrug resistance outer membrane protein [Nitrospira moscoviensis]